MKATTAYITRTMITPVVRRKSPSGITLPVQAMMLGMSVAWMLAPPE
jgi:hypothetical protein